MPVPTRAEARALLADLDHDYYLIENRRRIRNKQGGQFNDTRRAAPWGTRGPIPQGVLHSYEADISFSLIAAAEYIVTRTTPGSYHGLAGDDHPRDVMPMAPVAAETWHCIPSNPWAIGWSAVMKAHTWRSIPARSRTNIVKSLAYGFYLSSLELIAMGKDPIPAKRITRAEAMRGVWGFTMHRHMDPGRRSDIANPESDFPWDEFFAEYTRLLGGTTDTTEIEEGLTVADISRIIDAINDLPRRMRGMEIDLSTAAQGALSTKRKTWRLDEYLSMLGHRAGLTFKRTDNIQAQVDGLTEALMAVGEVSGMDRTQVQQIVADTIARSKVSLELPDDDQEA